MILHQLLVEEGSLAEPACASQQAAAGRPQLGDVDATIPTHVGWGTSCEQFRYRLQSS